MILVDTLKNNPPLVDQLLRDLQIYTLSAGFLYALPLAREKDVAALRSIILAWAQSVQAAAVLDSEKTHTALECGPDGIDFSL